MQKDSTIADVFNENSLLPKHIASFFRKYYWSMWNYRGLGDGAQDGGVECSSHAESKIANGIYNMLQTGKTSFQFTFQEGPVTWLKDQGYLLQQGDKFSFTDKLFSKMLKMAEVETEFPPLEPKIACNFLLTR